MSYKVDLDVFAGPLDLLLHLIQQEEVEIHEVPIARICDQYLAYLRVMQSLDIDVTGEFLVMAATLMAIKARALLPSEEVDLDEELDPERNDLIKQLLEYKKFKTLSRELSTRAIERGLRFRQSGDEEGIELPLEEVGLFDLVTAFAQLMRETGMDRAERVIEGEKPLRTYIDELLQQLREAPRLQFRDLFRTAFGRADVIGLFIALLELIKQGVARAVQRERFGSIEIELIDPASLEGLPAPD
jgi:segregation and condensation protein A